MRKILLSLKHRLSICVICLKKHQHIWNVFKKNLENFQYNSKKLLMLYFDYAHKIPKLQKYRKYKIDENISFKQYEKYVNFFKCL